MENKLLKSIKEHEGFESKPYIDPIAKQNIPKDELAIIEKHWDSLNITIGIGRNLSKNPLRPNEIYLMLNNDIEEIIETLRIEFDSRHNFTFDKFPNYVQDVLTEMAYQLGVDGLFKFKRTIGFLLIFAYGKAGEEMLNSKWARQTPNRAKKLSSLMKGGY